jgi:hypothetical protein
MACVMIMSADRSSIGSILKPPDNVFCFSDIPF